jgi:hypothetical protein
MVRMSLGCYSTADDVDRMIDGLEALAAGRVAGTYRLERSTGEFVPEGFRERLGDYFPWMAGAALPH